MSSWLRRSLSAFRKVGRGTLGVPEGPRRVPPRSRILRALVRSNEPSLGFVLFFGAAYLAVLVFGHLHHELWRDETHPWIVARQAEGFWDLLTGDRRYDGHPPGWFWYLRPFTFFTRDIVGLHVATILLSLGGALLLLRFAPFSRPIRVLLTFSFLFAFEYGVLSRNYTLGVLFTFLFCSLLHPLRPRPLLLAFCLLGLALSSVYGAILASCLLLVLLAESTRLARASSLPGVSQLRIETRALLAGAIALGGIVFSLSSSRPPDPNPYAPGVNLEAVNYLGFEASIARLTWSTLPMRVFDDINYWGGLDYVWREHPMLFTTVGWTLVGTMVLVLAAFPVELSAFLIGAGLMVVVQLAVYPGSVRHWGHYFLLFLALAWTGRVRHPKRWGFVLPTLLLVVGCFQFPALVVALREEQRFSFSGGPEVAEFIRRSKLEHLPLMGGPDWAMPAVMGHLDQDFVSCETLERNQTLVFHARRQLCSPWQLLQKASSIANELQAPVLLVTIGQLGGVPPGGVRLQRLFQSRRPTATAEDFTLYRVIPAPNVPAPPAAPSVPSAPVLPHVAPAPSTAPASSAVPVQTPSAPTGTKMPPRATSAAPAAAGSGAPPHSIKEAEQP